jgi:hypothetical protein
LSGAGTSRSEVSAESKNPYHPFRRQARVWEFSPRSPSFYLFTTEVITDEVGYPPSPLVYWNHRVRRKFPVRSLNLKDLHIRSLITKDLASISSLLVVKPACPIDILGHPKWPVPLGPLCCYQRSSPPTRALQRGTFEAKSVPKWVSGGFYGQLGRRTPRNPLLIRAYCRAWRVWCL